jgi:uncharacterized protein YbjT (DUF2867 family)
MIRLSMPAPPVDGWRSPYSPARGTAVSDATAHATRAVLVTGATGYMGRALIPALCRRGHEVRALTRPASAHRVPDGCAVVTGDVLDRATFAHYVRPGDTVVHLVGTPHPSPSKAPEFERVDLASVREAVAAARAARAAHFVYVSVAHPAPVMRAYVDARLRGEALVRESGLPATILRPWYVLGPGHRWPYALLPAYWLLARLPATRAGARRLALVTLRQMVAALASAVERPADGVRVMDVAEIRAIGRAADARHETQRLKDSRR